MNNGTVLWEAFREKSQQIEVGMDTLKRKRIGSYYTDIELTDIMMNELVANLCNGDKAIYEYKFLEPCVGAGNFVFSYIRAVYNLGISCDEAKILVDNIYAADINCDALQGYSEMLKALVNTCWGIELTEEYFEKHLGTGLLVDVTAAELDYIPLQHVFPKEIAERKFDIVVTNPPYKNLKAERGHYSSDSEYEADKIKYASIAKIVSEKFNYAIDGVLNLYKLFAEEIIDRYSNDRAYISLLIPASILSDKTCMKLRTHILKDTNLLSVKVIGEGNRYIDAQQALSAILLQKGKTTSVTNVAKDFCANSQDTVDISIEDIMNENTGNAIIAISQKEYNRLRKLRQFPVVKDLDFIINLRGELDLTQNKKYIVENNTGYPLLRGRNIGYYGLVDVDKKEYVSEEFVLSTKKKCFIKCERIICQQIANMHKERRVTCALAPANYILGNSCNFISVNSNEYGIDIYTLLGLFNTRIINWLFKLTSSNNHVNNYEIDCFPVPVSAPQLREISMLVQEYLQTGNAGLLEQIELLAEKAYGIIEGE